MFLRVRLGMTIFSNLKIDLTITILITYHFVSLFAQHGKLDFAPVEIQNVAAIPVLDYIYQDKRGVMWFGTYGGLYEYDGYNAIHYFHDPSDSNSLHDNKVTYLFADESERHCGALLRCRLFVGFQRTIVCPARYRAG